MDDENTSGDTPLLVSCLYRHVSLATLLLDRGSAAIDAKDVGGNAPLHYSCMNQEWEIARLLLERGSHATDENIDGLTPLHLACRYGSLEVSRLLLDRSSTAIDGSDSTPLHYACHHGHLSMSYGASTRKRTRWRTPAWTGRQRTRRTSTFDRCRRTRHPANGWGTAVNSPWKVYHLRRSVRAA